MASFEKYYEYFDPNKLLRDLYEFKKEFDRRFTYATIAKKAGIKSTGNLTDILQGHSKITTRLIIPLANAFDLKKMETKYFSTLVNYALAKTHQEKSYYFEQLLEIKKHKTRDLEITQYDYFSKWYYIAIRELMDFYRFKDDFKSLAKKLQPEITASQARKAIQTLEANGLIKKNPDGYYELLEANVSSGSWKSMAIAKFQMNTLDLAKESLDTVHKSDRSISTVTLNISKDSMQKIKDVLKRARQDLLDIADKDKYSDRVVHVGLNVFPMTKVNGKKSEKKND